MSLINFCTDHFVDKLLSLPLNMKSNSFTQGSSLCLMSNSSNLHLHTEKLLNDLFENCVCSHCIDCNSVERIKTESFFRNLSNNFLGSNKFVSPHVSNFVQNTIHFINSRSYTLLSPKSLNTFNILNDFCPDPALMKHTYSNPEIDFVDKQMDIVSVQEPKITMSVTVKNLPQKENPNRKRDKCNVPNAIALNLELASRKTKELQKRSKKRRRRQKKIHAAVKSSNLEDEVDSCKKSSPVSSRVCFSTSPKEESGFVVQVKHQMQDVPNLISSFLISVENISDESDWDSCTESDIYTETDDFELTGLVLTNLNTPSVCSTPYSFSVEMKLAAFCPEDEETCKFQAALLEVNKKWNEATKEVKREPKSSSKVSFAPDDNLVEVFFVEICERKGEWETYAIERLRFKRRIDDLAKVISPCLAAEHRLEVYRKVIEPAL